MVDYFIHYGLQDGTRDGEGCLVITLDRVITDGSDIASVKKQVADFLISNENVSKEVSIVVRNFILLKDDSGYIEKGKG